MMTSYDDIIVNNCVYEQELVSRAVIFSAVWADFQDRSLEQPVEEMKPTVATSVMCLVLLVAHGQ